MARDNPLTWKILVVDDENDVLTTTRHTLMDASVQDRPLEILTADSAAAAEQQLQQHPDIAVILLDVVMEKMHSGLALVNRIRNELGNHAVRIILRTGKPGEAPERDVVVGYAIDDYIDKGSVTRARLITAVITAVRAYDQFVRVDRMNVAMAALLEFSNAAATQNDLPSLGHLVARALGKVSPGLVAGGVAFAIEGQHNRGARLSFIRAELKNDNSAIDTPQMKMAQILLAKASRLKPKEYFLHAGAGEFEIVIWAYEVKDFETIAQNALQSLASTVQVNLQRLALMHKRSEEFMAVLGVVVHEFKTPLGALAVAHEYLIDAFKMPDLDRPRVHHLLTNNVAALDKMRLHLDSTTRNLDVVLGRIRGQQTKRHDVGEIVSGSVEALKALWRPVGELKLSIDKNCQVVLDKSVFEQILFNLLSNAVKAVLSRQEREPGPQITVEVRQRAGVVFLEVSDRGVGIPSEFIPRIYDPFYSNESTSHGLGLTMVKQSVQRMGGAIRCVSQSGQGTQITVQFEADTGPIVIVNV